MSHQHQPSSIWKQLCPMAQMCDVPWADEGATQGHWGQRGDIMPCPNTAAVTRGVPIRCPHVPDPSQCPPPYTDLLADIFISVHTYTHSSQGSSILAGSMQGLLCAEGTPRFPGVLRPKPCPPHPHPGPVVSTWGNSPLQPPGQGCAPSPCLSFPLGHSTPTSRVLTPQPGGRTLELQMLKLPRWSLLGRGGSSITPTPA